MVPCADMGPHRQCLSIAPDALMLKGRPKAGPNFFARTRSKIACWVLYYRRPSRDRNASISRSRPSISARMSSRS